MCSRAGAIRQTGTKRAAGCDAGRVRRPLLLTLAAALLSGCGGVAVSSAGETVQAPVVVASQPPSPATQPSPVTVTRKAAPKPRWVVGASPLPLRPDGFGQVLPTPPLLRDRRLPTTDVLPPPAGGRFASTVSAVSADVRRRMGQSWSPACPVALRDLRYLTLSFRGFDGKPHTGELVVHARAANDLVKVFRQLYEAGFPIEEMRLPTTADLDAAPTGDGNNTASYVCRPSRGQKSWSQHAYGLAVDINPFHNPFVKRDLVLPELASAYKDRRNLRPGMHRRGGAAVWAFAGIGWEWGGDWRSSKDYMHFSQNGR